MVPAGDGGVLGNGGQIAGLSGDGERGEGRDVRRIPLGDDLVADIVAHVRPRSSVGLLRIPLLGERNGHVEEPDLHPGDPAVSEVDELMHEGPDRLERRRVGAAPRVLLQSREDVRGAHPQFGRADRDRPPNSLNPRPVEVRQRPAGDQDGEFVGVVEKMLLEHRERLRVGQVLHVLDDENCPAGPEQVRQVGVCSTAAPWPPPRVPEADQSRVDGVEQVDRFLRVSVDRDADDGAGVGGCPLGDEPGYA